MFLEEANCSLADLVEWRAVSDGFLAGELGGEVDAFAEDVGFLLLGHLVCALCDPVNLYHLFGWWKP